MGADWAALHRPVISRKGVGHVLYTKWTMQEPMGAILMCNKTCKQVLDYSQGDTNIRYHCPACKMRCYIPLFPSDRTTALGRAGLVKTVFPQPQYPAQWVAEGTWSVLPYKALISHYTPPPILPPPPSNAPARGRKLKAPTHLAPPEVLSRSVSLPESRQEALADSQALKIRILPPKGRARVEPSKRSTSQGGSVLVEEAEDAILGYFICAPQSCNYHSRLYSMFPTCRLDILYLYFP